MIFKGINMRYRNIKRYRKIVEVFIKHGFGYLIEVMDLRQFVPLRKRIKALESKKPPQDCRATRVRKVLEELGPTYIKLGQLLSTRPDLIPRNYIDEFEKLQDQVPPMEFKDVVEQINSELEGEYGDYFSELSNTPLASASIGQVHKAILKTGEEVVVKVQRKDIQKTIETDLDIMSNLANLLKNKVFTDNIIDPVEIVDNFSKMIKEELDYCIEARNSKKFQNNFNDEEDVIIPKVIGDLTTKKVFTMEFIKGFKINKSNKKLKNHDIPQIISESFMKQIMIDGFFHGDPHPGNLIITDDYKVALLDFGLVGQLSKEDRERIANLFIYLLRKDIDKFIEQLLDLGMVTKEIDMRSLRRDFYRLVDEYHGVALEEIDLSTIMNRLLDLSFKYKIKLPVEFILLVKSLVTVEGVVAKVDPEFDILTVARPFAKQIIKERLSPKRLAKETTEKLQEITKYLSDLPKEIHNFFSLIQEEDLEIKFNHIGLDPLISKMDIITNRLSISLIISALIIGSSLIMLIDKGPSFLGYPILGVSGFLIAAILGMWLVFSILKSGRF
ncbi:ABC1 kinase family protein [Orenia marismortui]|uniref:2-octaprenylphenol hydroxylase n=1 Tax=Orenia marismortui TaxID=46469 RepID=A0A4R8GQD2_9FIRM|nr:AarF/UbiB family protein [Orenia marismortui]TDX48005.1 2-octaprenylphenol hydroxylase [Orenia marismortui]